MYLRQILDFFPESERIRFVVMFVYITGGSILGTLSVISTGTFLAIVANRKWIEIKEYIIFLTSPPVRSTPRAAVTVCLHNN